MTATVHFQESVHPAATLDPRARRLVAGLHAMGVGEGDVIAVLMRNDPVFLEIILACRIGGFYYCPINWHYTPSEIAYILGDSGAKAIIGDSGLLAAAEAVIPPEMGVLAVGGSPHPARGFEFEEWLDARPEHHGPAVAPRGHMAYTSGTTGRPKGVRRDPVPVDRLDRHRASMIEIMDLCFGLRAGSRALMTAPLYHSAPSLFSQWALQLAEVYVLEPGFDAERVLALVERHKISTLYCVPTMLIRLLRLPEHIRDSYDLSSLHFVGCTGAPFAAEVKAAATAWLGPLIHESYASSESGMITTIGPDEAALRPGSVGRPLAGAQVRIVDAEKRDLAPGEPGTIYVRQPAYPDFTYLNRPQDRIDMGLDGFITLGDAGYVDDDGYLYLCDRISDMVISGGVNIYPAEIEGAILAEPGVLDCAVFGVPDPEFGERLVALVQPRPDATVDLGTLATALGDRLARYKIPRTFELVGSLPRDPNGKIAKHRLRADHLRDRARPGR